MIDTSFDIFDLHLLLYNNMYIIIISLIFIFRAAKEEILALTQMAEQINSKFNNQNNNNVINNNIMNNNIISDASQLNGNHPPSLGSSSATQHSNESVDLDNLFAFLSEVQPSGNNSNQIIDEIGEKMDTLVEDLDVEVYILYFISLNAI